MQRAVNVWSGDHEQVRQLKHKTPAGKIRKSGDFSPKATNKDYRSILQFKRGA